MFHGALALEITIDKMDELYKQITELDEAVLAKKIAILEDALAALKKQLNAKRGSHFISGSATTTRERKDEDDHTDGRSRTNHDAALRRESFQAVPPTSARRRLLARDKQVQRLDNLIGLDEVQIIIEEEAGNTWLELQCCFCQW